MKKKNKKQSDVSYICSTHNQYCEIFCFAFFSMVQVKTIRLVSKLCFHRFTEYKNLLFICSDSVLVLAYCYP